VRGKGFFKSSYGLLPAGSFYQLTDFLKAKATAFNRKATYCTQKEVQHVDPEALRALGSYSNLSCSFQFCLPLLASYAVDPLELMQRKTTEQSNK
jgi:hypothetical protein